ncbi:MAG: universal stress protein [Marinoscillum sp.]
MSTIKKITVPVDFSESANAALHYVADLTRGFPDKEVTFIHVADKITSEIERKLRETQRGFTSLSDASCKAVFKSGDLTTEVIKYQKMTHQDLIIMGTEGRESEDSSHSSDMVLAADCPVMIIPKNKTLRPLKNIVLALDKDTIDDSLSLQALYNLAREKDATVHVLTIETEENGKFRSSEANESVLDFYLETLDWKSVFPKSSDIEKGIEDYVERNEIDLVALLPRNHAKHGRPSEGKLAKALSLHSKVPVLTLD